MTIDELFERFINYKVSQGLRERTLQDHKKLYRYFRDWLQQKIPNPKVGDISRETVQAYITYMAQEIVQFLFLDLILFFQITDSFKKANISLSFS